MATFETLPTEIIIEIAEYIYDADERRLPVIGASAPWAMPPTIYSLHDGRNGGDDAFPPFFEEILDGSEDPGGEARDLFVRGTGHQTSLKALRCTNRLLSQICEPFLYRELDLRLRTTFYRWGAFASGSRELNWDHVQYLAINLTMLPLASTPSPGPSEEYDSHVSKFRNLKHLALYYLGGSIVATETQKAVVKLLEVGSVRYLGIYSDILIEELGRRSWVFTLGITELIDAICLSPIVGKNLRAFDVVVESIPSDTFDLIRSKLTSLESLTIRRTLEAPDINYRLWDTPQQSKWSIYPNLTRLNLAHFDAGHAPHIPPLVRHFTALRELIISACGAYADRGERRTNGWSNLREAMCNIRPALNLLWIEHMIEWEIYDLGTIPTKALIITTVDKRHLLANLRNDAEIFPRLEVLRLAPPNQDRGDAQPPVREDAVVFGNELEDDGMPSVKGICDARGITIRRDAVAKWTCDCCDRETGWY